MHFYNYNRPCLHKYVFIKNDTVFNENSMIILHLLPFSHHFHVVFNHLHENDEIELKTVKTSENLLSVCQDDLNDL